MHGCGGPFRARHLIIGSHLRDIPGPVDHYAVYMACAQGRVLDVDPNPCPYAADMESTGEASLAGMLTTVEDATPVQAVEAVTHASSPPRAQRPEGSRS